MHREPSSRCRLWAAAAYGNAGDYAHCDSLLRLIRPMRDRLAPLDRGLADMWEAVIPGDFTKKYLAGKEVVAAAPSSELARYIAGVSAIDVNQFDEAVRLLRSIPVERSAALWDIYGTRLPQALHLAGRHREELEETERRRRHQPTLIRAMDEQLRALVALGRLDDANRVMTDVMNLAPDSSMSVGAVLFTTAEELLVHDHPREALVMFRRAAAWARGQPRSESASYAVRVVLVRSLIESGELAEADSLSQTFFAAQPTATVFLTAHGLAAAHRGDSATADSVASRLAALETPYLHGSNTIDRARIAAVLGRKAAATRLAGQARSGGVTLQALHLFPEFQSLRGYSDFGALLRPKR